VRVAKIWFENFLCFRGHQELQLESLAYAVSAQRDGDREKSNASGKTAFLEGIGFALWGKHRHRTEDAWISNGEDHGGVGLELDDGTCIIRTRIRGKSTRLQLIEHRGTTETEMTRDQAELRLIELIGINETDFYATRHLEQRQVARFILSRPEDRMNSVSTWVGLGPLERAEERARDLLSTVVTQIETAERVRQGWQEKQTHALGPFKNAEELLSARKDAEQSLTIQKQKLEEISTKRFRVEADATFRASVEQYESLIEEGTKLKTELDKMDGGVLKLAFESATECHRDILEQRAQTNLRLKQVEGPARGTFDGTCPVAELQCPIKEQINQRRGAAKKTHEAAIALNLEMNLKFATTAGDLTKHRNAFLDYQEKQARLKEMRARALKLQPDMERRRQVDLSSSLEEPKAQEADQRKVVDEGVSKVTHFTWAVQSYADATKLIEVQNAEIKKLTLAEQTASQATLIFGRNGAQRRVAESALAQIEARANEALDVSNINLQVKVQWAREGQGLATACEACGHPFPSSTKVRACGRCNAARGPKLVHRLDLELSDRSAALEDLAGVTVAMGAGAWLRDKRGSQWGTILIDEAWGQLDASHRRALSSGLPSMLRSWGAEQAFITAHHASVLDSLPARIEVSRQGKWSELRVIG